MSDLHFLTIVEASKRIATRDLSPVDLTQAVLDRIEATNQDLHAYRDVFAASALDEARNAEAEIKAGRYKGPLHGIPVAHKEVFDVAGHPNRARSRDPKAVPPSEDATSVRRLREAGSILLGTLVAGGSEGASSPRNPWNTEHITGGSSAGSGAAVAAGLALGSVGEDTAGSIRRPASMCGIVGFKPTFGLVSIAGMAPLTWSMDYAGPLTWTVEDNALMLQVIAGHDPGDPNTTRTRIPDYSAALQADPKGLVIGVPRKFIDDRGHRADPEVISAMDAALALLESRGARIVEVDVPSLPHATIANTIIHYSQGLAMKEAQGEENAGRPDNPMNRVRQYMAGLASNTDYVRAQLLRKRLIRELMETLDQVTVLATPAQVEAAPRLDEYHPLDNPLRQLQNLDAPFNLVGLPAISVPCGFTSKALPIGLQLVGKPFDEVTVLRAAYAYEQQARWFEKRPRV